MIVNIIIFIAIVIFIIIFLKVLNINIMPKFKSLRNIAMMIQHIEQITLDNLNREKQLKQLIYKITEITNEELKKIIEINKHLDGIVSKKQFNEVITDKYNSKCKCIVVENKTADDQNINQDISKEKTIEDKIEEMKKDFPGFEDHEIKEIDNQAQEITKKKTIEDKIEEMKIDFIEVEDKEVVDFAKFETADDIKDQITFVNDNMLKKKYRGNNSTKDEDFLNMRFEDVEND